MRVAILLGLMAMLAACSQTASKYKAAFGDSFPADIRDHTYQRYTADGRHSVEYFAPDGLVYLIRTGSLQIERGRWSDKGGKLCLSLLSRTECQDKQEWAKRIVSGYRTDYLKLSERANPPCILKNTEFIPNFALAYYRKELTEYDNDFVGTLDCRERILALFRDDLISPYDSTSGAVLGRCIRSIPQYILADGTLDGQGLLDCADFDIKRTAEPGLVSYAEFQIRNVDRSFRRR